MGWETRHLKVCTVSRHHIFKPKFLPVDCLSYLIIKYTCDSCNAVHIGETVQTFKCRVSPNMGISPRIGAILATPVQSDIGEHCLKHGKQINGDNLKYLTGVHKNLI